MTKIKYISTLFVVFAFVTTANAQNTKGLLELFFADPNSATQFNTLSPSDRKSLENLASPFKQQGKSDFLPSAESATTPNTEDLFKDGDLVRQSGVTRPERASVVQKYFEILTGEKLEVYGVREFMQQQDDDLLFFNTVDKNYRLAPGDVLRVTLRGLEQSDRSYKIGNNGNLILPNLPPIVVSGLTIDEVEDHLLRVLQYDDASAGVFIAVETARLITIQVSGSVSQPRTIAVPAYTPLSRIFAYAGGIEPNGSLRNIVLRERNGSFTTLDFYDILQSPLGSYDPIVKEEARVFVPNQGATVATSGFVARPGIYELPKDEMTIAVSELLELSGTTILTPGIVLEAKFFDKNGISNTRELTLNDKISAGEVLNLRFVETRLRDAVTVMGAVLNKYSISSSEPIPLRDLLKGGATLKPNAKLNFAMMIESNGTVRTFDLERALLNDSQLIPVGAKLFVFDQSSYRMLVRSNPNITDDPLVAAIARAEVAEIYLNGERLAFIPPVQTTSFAGALEPYYRLTPNTNLELAVIEAADGTAVSVSLRELMQDAKLFTMAAGSKVHIFETNFLNNFVKCLDFRTCDEDLTTKPDRLTTKPDRLTTKPNGLTTKPDRLTTKPDSTASLARLLARAKVVRIKLDDELVAVLPQSPTRPIIGVLDVLGLKQSVSTLIDLVAFELQSEDNRHKYKSISLMKDYLSTVPTAHSISFWSKAGFEKYLNTASEQQLEDLFSIAVPVFVNYELTKVLSPSSFHTTEGTAANLIHKEKIYSLFSVLRQFDTKTMTWKTFSKLTSDHLKPVDKNSRGIKAGDQLSLFTWDFINTELAPNDIMEQEQFTEKGQNFSSSRMGDAEQNFTITALNDARRTSEIGEEKVQSKQQFMKPISLQKQTALLKSYSRYIGGAVQHPGQYPIAAPVTLDTIINMAGGLLASANTKNVTVQYLNEKGATLVRGKKQSINLDIKRTGSTLLRGQYTINVPHLINDAATGLVTLSGEVMRPGKYIIARDETVHDLIKRAGGLSPVAYPLGAVFSRQSLKDTERTNNAALAKQLEKAVMTTSTSDNANAKEQARSLLTYATRLREQPTMGRMSVNVTYAKESAPVYMQDNDLLFIPKRPSHVLVLGAVARDATVSFAPGRSLDAYLDAAGGATKLANFKRSYLLLPNGESTRLSRGMQIPPGAAIVVVPRTDKLSLLGITDIVSRVLGNIATSILAIDNVVR